MFNFCNLLNCVHQFYTKERQSKYFDTYINNFFTWLLDNSMWHTNQMSSNIINKCQPIYICVRIFLYKWERKVVQDNPNIKQLRIQIDFFYLLDFSAMTTICLVSAPYSSAADHWGKHYELLQNTWIMLDMLCYYYYYFFKDYLTSQFC